MCACFRAALAKIDRRLRTPAQFAAVAAARGRERLQGARRWLALTAFWVGETQVRITPSAVSAASCHHTRLGLVVPKRWARRALDRNLVKRVAREAMHRAGAALDAVAKSEAQEPGRYSNNEVRLDVVIRLKAALPRVEDLARARLRTMLRTEADDLLAALAREMARTGAMSRTRSASDSPDSRAGPV